MRIPLLDLQAIHAPLRAELDAAIAAVLDSNAFVLGSEVNAFEEEFAAFCGVPYGIGVASGTDALALSLEACGVGPGDEVIVPAFTFIATASVVSRLGARVVFADVDPDTACLEAAALQRALTPATKAVVAVHLYGHPADMQAIKQALGARDVAIIEDAAQAHGARYHSQSVGGLASAGCFSFYPSKNLGAFGEGGMVVVRGEALADRLRALRNHGRRGQFEHVTEGCNSRLHTLQAAVLRVKLRHLPAWNEERRRLAALYDQRLAAIAEVRAPSVAAGAEPVYHQYVVRADRREELRTYLHDVGIATAVYYPAPLHLQPAYQQEQANGGWRAGDFPAAETLARTALSLPLYPGLSAAAVHEVCEVIAAFYAR